jgi:hypothetical protein
MTIAQITLLAREMSQGKFLHYRKLYNVFNVTIQIAIPAVCPFLCNAIKRFAVTGSELSYLGSGGVRHVSTDLNSVRGVQSSAVLMPIALRTGVVCVVVQAIARGSGLPVFLSGCMQKAKSVRTRRKARLPLMPKSVPF